MHAKEILGLAALVLAVVGFAVPVSAADDAQQAERQEVEQANADFYTGLNAMFTGDTTGIEKVWSQADDITLLGPDGEFVIGWDQVRSRFEEEAALKLGGKIEAHNAHVTLGNDLAFVQCFEIGENEFDGQTVQVSIRATNIFRKENGQWRLISHHTDVLPFLQKEALTKSVE